MRNDFNDLFNHAYDLNVYLYGARFVSNHTLHSIYIQYTYIDSYSEPMETERGKKRERKEQEKNRESERYIKKKKRLRRTDKKRDEVKEK